LRETQFQFRNQLSELEACRKKIDEFIGIELDSKTKNRIILSLDEAVSNIIEHGFPDATESLISIFIQLDTEKILFHLEDSGIAFNPLDAKPVDIDEHLEIGEDGGVGIHIVQKIMNVEYQRIENKNRLTLSKKLRGET
jgi:serine/threonine-protein kinase RsbW